MVGIQFLQFIYQRRLCRHIRQSKCLAEHADFVAGSALIADVDSRRRVVANQHCGQAWIDLVFLEQFGHTHRHFGADFFGQCPPVQYFYQKRISPILPYQF